MLARRRGDVEQGERSAQRPALAQRLALRPRDLLDPARPHREQRLELPARERRLLAARA